MGRGLGCRLLLSAPTPSEAWTDTAFLHLPSLSYCSVNTRKGRAGLWVAENGDRSAVCEGPGLPETWARKEEREAQILFWLGETVCLYVCVCMHACMFNTLPRTNCFFFKDFFYLDLFKVFVEFVTILLLVYVLVFLAMRMWHISSQF